MDHCRAMPRMVEISLPFSATANTHYYIANPWIFAKATPLSKSQNPSQLPAPLSRSKTVVDD